MAAEVPDGGRRRGLPLREAADHHLVDASAEASLVLPRRPPYPPFPGAHIGPVTHAVLHYATAPVAVAPA